MQGWLASRQGVGGGGGGRSPFSTRYSCASVSSSTNVENKNTYFSKWR